MSVSQERCLPFGHTSPSAHLLLALYLRGSTKQLFALDTVPIKSLPTSISEKLTQLKKSQTN